MIWNGKSLLEAAPIEEMHESKKSAPGGTSFGLVEGGYDIRIAQTIWLHPFRRNRLASTIERFNMPLFLQGEVADKSTWIRQWVRLGNTKIEPGWRGWLTLELEYTGWWFLRIPKGAGIAQIVFHELKEPGDYGDGKYQDQENRPVKARREPRYLGSKRVRSTAAAPNSPPPPKPKR